MLQFSGVQYPVLVDSGLIYLGYSTALVPIRETEDGMILWHLQIATDDFQLKVANLKATKHDWLQTEDLNYLKSKRALLDTHIFPGTDRLDQSYLIYRPQ